MVVATPLKKGSQIFPEGAPDVRLLVAGAPSYDPPHRRDRLHRQRRDPAARLSHA